MTCLADMDNGQLLDEIYGNVALVHRADNLTGTEQDCLFMALRGIEEMRVRINGI